MSLAWAPLAILLLLLPGIFFFIGLASYERWSREIIRSSVVSEVAMATGIAIAVHFLSLCLISAFGFQLSTFIAPLVEAAEPEMRASEFVHAIAGRLVPATIYLGGTTVIGFALGVVVSISVVSGPLRRIARHQWIYDIVDVGRKGGIVTAFVMTNIINDSKIIMYRGRVHDLFLDQNGKIAYLVLKNCSRYHMAIKDDELTTGRQLELFGSRQAARPSHVWDRLLIDGSNIANVLFDSSPEIKGQAEGQEALRVAFREAMERTFRQADQKTQREQPLPETGLSAT